MDAAAPPAPGQPSPGLAFALGLIPGVGAVYNGQYGKGILHVVVLGLLISIMSSNAADDLEPLFGMFVSVWFFYMAFEAYHTAKKRLAGERVDEFSGLLGAGHPTNRLPIGPITLIVLGVVFLLNTLGLWSLHRILRFWPVLLIATGLYLLFGRVAGRSNRLPPVPGEPPSISGAGDDREDLR